MCVCLYLCASARRKEVAEQCASDLGFSSHRAIKIQNTPKKKYFNDNRNNQTNNKRNKQKTGSPEKQGRVYLERDGRSTGGLGHPAIRQSLMMITKGRSGWQRDLCLNGTHSSISYAIGWKQKSISQIHRCPATAIARPIINVCTAGITASSRNLEDTAYCEGIIGIWWLRNIPRILLNCFL